MKTNLKSTARLAVTAGLCASLLMGSMPVQVFADEIVSSVDGAEAGNQVNPASEVVVSNQKELRAALENSGVSKVVLSSDIVMEEEWEPLRIDRGRVLLIDGSGHAISGMRSIKAYQGPNGTGIPGDGGSGDYYCGFISDSWGTVTIQNLTFVNAEVDIKQTDASKKSSGSNCLGVVVGNNSGRLSISDVAVEGSVVRGYSKVGGLVGFTQNDGKTSIDRCKVRNTEIVLEADGTDPEACLSGVVVGYDGNNATVVNGVALEGNRTTVSDSVKWNTEVLIDEFGSRYVNAYGSKWGLTCETYSRDGYGTSPAPLCASIEEYRYNSLAEALSAIRNGETISLVNDISENVVIPEGVTATIDLAGHKLSNHGDHTIVNKGNLTIVDSAGTGVIDCVTNAKGALVNEGECTIEGGKLTRSAEKGTPGGKDANTWYVVSNKGTLSVVGGEVVNTSKGSSLVSNTGTMSVSGGHFSNDFIAIKSEENSALSITGGAVDSKDQAVQNWGNAEISGGTLNGNVVTWAFGGYPSSTVIDGDVTINGEVGAVNYDGGDATPSVTIKDGTVTGEIFKGTFENGKLEKVEPTDDGATIEISGGAFGDKSAGDFIAPDAGLGLDQDGNFVPVEPAFTFADTVVNGTFTFDVLGGTAGEFSEADLLAFVGVNVVDYALSVDTSNLAALNKAIKNADASKSFDFKYTATKKASKAKATDINSITTVVTVRLVDTGDPTVQPVEKATVTFKDGFGGEFTQKVEVGSKLVKPEDPKRDGYKFAGWFETVNGNVVSGEWDFDKDVVEGDMTLYAGWFKTGASADQKPEFKPGSALPQTGDASAVAMVIPGIAGIAAIAAGMASSKRRKAE